MSKYVRKTEDYWWRATKIVTDENGNKHPEFSGGSFRVPIERWKAYDDWAKGKSVAELDSEEGVRRYNEILSPYQRKILERKTKGCLAIC